MSETREHGETEPAATAPFHFACIGCGADIDAPDRYFTLGPMVLVPHAHHVLIPVRCLTCETDHDLVGWTIDRQRFISEVGPGAFPPGDPQATALMERYEHLVEKHRCELEAQYDQQEAWPEVDLSGVDIEIQADRCFARPMAALAAARGLRQAVALRPGAQPPGVVRLGSYRCVLSFDETPQAPYPYALHLSVGNDVLPGVLPSYELHWLVSLFFTPGEVPLLLTQPGQTVPVVHYYLPAYTPDLNAS
jgi:hypothetical protein